MDYDVKIFQKDGEEYKIVKAGKSERLLAVLEKNGFVISAPCGGRGLCGKCAVKIKGCRQPVNPFEKDAIGTARLAEGYRLACMYPVESDLEVYLEQNRKNRIMTDFVLPCFETDPLVLHGNSGKECYGVSFDIGTTTVVGYLVNLISGETISAISEVNSQAIYGSDVISRITYALENPKGLESLRKTICHQIAGLLNVLAQRNGIRLSEIKGLSFAGNTVMLHFLQGLDVRGLSAYPYTPVSIKEVETNIYNLGIPLSGMEECPVFILPCISSFAGADTTAAILASGIVTSSRISLLVDIGTNGELVLGNRDRLFACSTAAGPAFEGASIKHGTGGVLGAIDSVKIDGGQVKITTIGNLEPIGVCGSGIIDAVAELLEAGVVDETGRMSVPEFLLYSKPSGEKITITAKDIREVQLAKGAITAGINILLKEMGIEAGDVERVFIAGGFGNYINCDNMFRIGLLRKEFKNKLVNIGNAAGAGAVAALLSKRKYQESIYIAKKCQYVELSNRMDFQEAFVNSISFTI